MKNDIAITVSEPWDFEGPDGANNIKGTIIDKVNDYCLIFKSNHLLNFGEITGDILILTPRHHENNFSDLACELIVVNGSVLLINYDKILNEKELKDNSKFKLIGSIS